MKLFSTKIVRRKEQFHCATECRKYFLTYLRNNMTGDYAIRCPNCGHLHYRHIVKGLVTKDRRNGKGDMLDIIESPASTISVVPHDLEKENIKILVSTEKKKQWLKEIEVSTNA